MARDADHTPDPLDVQLGLKIRTRRRELGISQQDLAQVTGVTFQQIQKYENGANRVSFSRLVKIARALSVSIAWFCDGLELEFADPTRATEVIDFWKSPAGQTIALAAPQLQPHARLALADLARSLAAAPPAVAA